MAGNSSDYFDSPRFQGVLPYLQHQVMVGGWKFSWKGYWRHLLFMEAELVLLTAPAPPSAALLLSQLDEARAPRPLGADDVWAVIPYDEVDRVRLHGGEPKSIVTRLLVKTHHWRVPRWKVDHANEMIFDFGSRWGAPYDMEKVTHARTLLPNVLPKRIELVGF
jgi:hypothetical protein